MHAAPPAPCAQYSVLRYATSAVKTGPVAASPPPPRRGPQPAAPGCRAQPPRPRLLLRRRRPPTVAASPPPPKPSPPPPKVACKKGKCPPSPPFSKLLAPPPPARPGQQASVYGPGYWRGFDGRYGLYRGAAGVFVPLLTAGDNSALSARFEAGSRFASQWRPLAGEAAAPSAAALGGTHSWFWGATERYVRGLAYTRGPALCVLWLSPREPLASGS